MNLFYKGYKVSLNTERKETIYLIRGCIYQSIQYDMYHTIATLHTGIQFNIDYNTKEIIYVVMFYS